MREPYYRNPRFVTVTNGKVLPNNFSAVVRSWAKIGNQTGKYLGTGFAGDAIRYGNRVLKITKSRNEAESSAMLIGKNSPNVIKIMDVKEGKEGPFFILSEFLNPVTDFQARAADTFRFFVQPDDIDNGLSKKVAIRKRDIEDSILIARNLLEGRNPEASFSRTFISKAEKSGAYFLASEFMDEVELAGGVDAVNENKALVEYYDAIASLIRAHKFLLKNGVDLWDYHSDNIGIRAKTGKVVVFDIEGRLLRKKTP